MTMTRSLALISGFGVSAALGLMSGVFTSAAEAGGSDPSCAVRNGDVNADERIDFIHCGSDAWPGQDAFSAAGCRSHRRFVDNGDGTVTDDCTGLMWLQATADTGGDGEVTTEDTRTWQEALQYCEDFEFAGYRDTPTGGLRTRTKSRASSTTAEATRASTRCSRRSPRVTGRRRASCQGRTEGIFRNMRGS
jgi:hypothetical protein